jgi:hypothetical protein
MKIVIGDNSRRNTPMIVPGVILSKILVLRHFLLKNTRMHGLCSLAHIELFRAGIVTKNKQSWYFDLLESRAATVIPTIIMDSLMRR